MINSGNQKRDPQSGTTRQTSPTRSHINSRSVNIESAPTVDDPLDWPVAQKWIVTAALSVTGFNRIMVSTIMAPALPTISNELQLGSVQTVMALSIYVLATAFSPLLIGPLSEVYGRAGPMHASNIFFLIFNILCGFVPNGATLITARFFAGLGAGAIYPLAAGVLGDLWPPEKRGVSLSVYLLIPLLGAAVGPIIGGFVEQYSTWRWCFWSTSVLQLISIVVCFMCYRETHYPTIRRRQEQRLLPPVQISWIQRSKHNFNDPTMRRLLHQSLTTPFRQLLKHRSVQIQSALSGFSYGLLYLVLSTFSSLFTDQYHQSTAISGLHYLAPCLGEIIGSQVGGRSMDAIARRMKRRRQTEVFDPVFRLPIMVPATLVVGVGLLLYGWSAQQHLPWIVVDLGAVVLLLAMQIVGQSLQAYNMDTYPESRASTTAAVQVFRSLGAFALPLAGPAMYNKLGYGWANVLLAGIYLCGNLTAVGYLWEKGSRLQHASP